MLNGKVCIVSILCKCDINNNYRHLLLLICTTLGLFPAEGQPWGMGDASEGRQIKGDLSRCKVRVNHMQGVVHF